MSSSLEIYVQCQERGDQKPGIKIALDLFICKYAKITQFWMQKSIFLCFAHALCLSNNL